VCISRTRTILASIVFLMTPCTDRVENTLSNSMYIVACVFVAAVTCLPSHCLETAWVYLLFSWSLHSNGSTGYNIVACLLGNATNKLWVLDLTLDLLGIRQVKLQLIITLLMLL
jgi:hypothetical protein